jgi:eukaryotic-like serine/threonine-protein kinase
VLAYRLVGETRLTWFDRTGRQLESVGPPGRYRNPALSPDEQRVAVARIDRETGEPDIWLIELTRGVTSRFTSHPSRDDMPIWSRDGRRIAFKTSRDRLESLYQKASSGHGPDEPLAAVTQFSLAPMDWSGDGFLIYGADDGTSRFSNDLWRLPLSGDRKPIPFLRTRFNETQGQLSPDGRWIAYVSNDSGSNEINISPFPSGEGKWPISTNGGVEPRWRGDGKEIFFVALDGSLMAVPVTTGSTVQASSPAQLFQTGMSGALSVYTRNQYVSTADGQRFLIDHQPRGRAPSSSVTVVVNWMAALAK